MTVMETTRTIVLPSGEHIPVLGQGTWHLAENPLNRTNEINALRLGIDLGMSLIDTAEMYADGGAERLVGEAMDVATRFFWSAKCYLRTPRGTARWRPATEVWPVLGCARSTSICCIGGG
jgi:diketogulonate reductase-like aldo/keto reductase